MLQPARVIITFTVTLSVIISYVWCLPYDSAERTADAGAGKNRTRILHHHNSQHSQLGSATEQEHSEHQDFLFPDSQEPAIDTEPSCASGEPFCETLQNYPHDHLKNVLRHTPGLDIFFGQDETPPDFTNRVADTGEEKFVCDARSKVVFPQSGKNSKNKWKFIVNQKDDDEGYVQGVRIEECVSPGKSCDVFNALPDGYKTTCKQKYIYRRLLCLSDNGTPAVDTFLFPSACCCSYKVDFNLVARSAAVAKTICSGVMEKQPSNTRHK